MIKYCSAQKKIYCVELFDSQENYWYAHIRKFSAIKTFHGAQRYRYILCILYTNRVERSIEKEICLYRCYLLLNVKVFKASQESWLVLSQSQALASPQQTNTYGSIQFLSGIRCTLSHDFVHPFAVIYYSFFFFSFLSY